VRRRPLSVRLALTLSLAVAGVLLVAAIVVNQLVSASLEHELTAAQRDRLTLLAQGLGNVNLPAAAGRPGMQHLFDRVARTVGGRVQLVDEAGSVLLAAGQQPDGSTVRVTEPVSSGYVLRLDLPSRAPPFLRVFNLTLLVAGLLSVVAVVIVAGLLSERLTRPLRGVADAARRLGAGDLAARAEGGPDRESADLAEAFNAMAARLEQSEALRRRAASDVAHDLATPATLLESQLQAMIDGVVPPDAEQLGRARAAAGTMSSLVAQLRELVDVEAAPLQRRIGRVAVAALLADARQAMQPLFRERGLVLEVVADERLEVDVDEAQVGRALRNVLTNAAQHSPDGAAVQLAAGDAEHHPPGVSIRVTDHGPGIPPSDVAHVFERFYRADPARSGREGSPGSGIGLTIARELLTANGGTIEVERSDAEGTIVRLWLPAPAGG
jgi:two-component system sensor histidine kinase BaeS